MGLLDKLKPQPRWKHTDAAIRLEGVREVEDVSELAALAETDPDVKVRRAAVARIEDPEVLGRIAASDADGETRDRAADRLASFACRGTGAESSSTGDVDVEFMRRAARALTDPRRLAAVAKSDAPDAVRAEALAAISDARALESIARQARQETTAADALAKLSGQTELLEVALNAGHKSVALTAFDRLAPTDPALLHTIELRAQHKSVGRKARAVIQDMEAAEAARQAAALERQRRESGLIEAAEALALVTNAAAAREELERLSKNWRDLGVTDGASHDRFTQAAAAVDAAIAKREREAQEERELARVRAEAIATRVALCERVETLEGEDVLAQLIPLEEEWRSLMPIAGDGPQASRLAERFTQAVGACRKRHEMGAALATTRAALEAVVVEAESLVPRAESPQATERWQQLSREARGLAATLSGASRPAEDLNDRLHAVAAAFSSRDAAKQAEIEAAREALLVRVRRLTERTRRAAEADTMTLREGERLMRDLGTTLEEADNAEASTDLSKAAADLRTWQEKVAPRVKELRDMDEWRKFANAQRQEQLISMAEAIVASLKSDVETGKTPDLAATSKALREMHTEWQVVADAPRQSAQRLWDRFRTSTDFIRARCEPYFAKRREEREVARARRAAVVEEAEALAQSHEWAPAAARLQALQAEWQSLAKPASDSERELGQRFRAACNTFFVRRREDLADRKKIWSENLAKKEALCARAEELAASTEWDAAAAEVKRLQAEWKTIGPVRKNQSEVIWVRFRTAADRFFERYHHRHEIALAGKLSEREALVVELEALAAAPADETPADAAATVQRLRATWNRAVPVPVPGMKVLADRWQAALASLLATRPTLFAGTELDPKAIIARMEKLVVRVEGLAADARDARATRLSSTELLAHKLRAALANNAMGGRSHEDGKARSAVDSAKDTVASWQRLPPVQTPEAEALAERFRRACQKLGVGDTGRRPASSGHQPRPQRSAPPPSTPEQESEAQPAVV